MLQFRVSTLAALTAAFCMLCWAVPASGSPPIPLPPNPDTSYAAGDVCPFPLRVTPEVNKSLLHILRSGDWIVTGKLIQRVTNLRTGKSLSITANGPVRVIFHDNGTFTLISHGSILWTFFSQDAGGPGLFLFTGRVVIEENADGFATSVSHIPKFTDICHILA
jgi:hypothetical protein